jgi:hypothetical protein
MNREDLKDHKEETPENHQNVVSLRSLGLCGSSCLAAFFDMTPKPGQANASLSALEGFYEMRLRSEGFYW